MGAHSNGFRADDWGDLAYLKCWGVTHVVGYGGKGKPIEIQTDDQARGNHAWFEFCDSVTQEEQDKAPCISSYRLSTLMMGDGKGKPRHVIHNGEVKEYVGIGWIPLRPARPKDYAKIPRVLD